MTVFGGFAAVESSFTVSVSFMFLLINLETGLGPSLKLTILNCKRNVIFDNTGVQVLEFW